MIAKTLEEVNNIDAARQAERDASVAELEQALGKKKQEHITGNLAKHIDKIWRVNQRDCKPYRTQMIKALQSVRGEYSQEMITAIRSFRGSEAFIRSSENKCRAAESWIKDIYLSETDQPWDLEPTAVPDLPDETQAQIAESIQSRALAIRENLLASGQVPDPNAIVKLMNEWMQEETKKAQDDLFKQAKQRCDKAAQIIRDQNQEGGWAKAFKNFLWYFTRVKFGIIKGPILTKKRKQIWDTDAEGNFVLNTTDTLVNDVYCVSPFNFYPTKGMVDINDGDVIEIHELTKQSITDLLGVPGYSEEEVRAVISELEAGELRPKWLLPEDQTQVKQAERGRDKYNYSYYTNQQDDTILAQEFYGTVSGKLLLEWGIEGSIDEQIQYQANCWKIGNHVIKAVINPDTLGRKPYHISSWAKNPASIWGEGLIEFVEPIEAILNSITRAMQNNIAIASGPQVEVNVDRCDDKTPIYPWKRWDSTSMQMKEAPALNFYQPQMHTQELVYSWQFFSKLMDEMTVPAYAQGASQSGVTAGTATVFTQLLAAASRSIKAVVANIDDDIIVPYTQMCYDYNMKFTNDNTIKGDAHIVAKGVAGLQAREQAAQRKVEYLQVIANPLFSQILGPKNIGSILAQIAKSNDIKLPDVDRLDGTSEIEAMVQQLVMGQAGVDPNQMTGQIGAGGTPTNPEGMNPDGSPAGQVNQP